MHTPFLSNRLGRWLAVTLLALTSATAAHAQLAGPKAIPGDYATVAAAITDLNAQGVGAGGVTFNIAAGYTETFASPTAGAITASGTAAGRIVFQKAGAGANPKITAGVGTSTTLDAIISLAGSDYVTFDGLDVAESASNATATTQAEFGYALFRASATDGAQFNIIRNCVVTLAKTNVGTIGIAGLASASTAVAAVSATSTSGANSGNKIYGNVVTNSLVGIYLAAGSATAVAFYDQNNEIGVTAGNTVGNFGGTASAYGVGGTYQNGLKVSGNTINSTLNYTSATASTAVAASTVTSTLRGIYTPSGTSSNIDITNNTITLASGGTSSQMSGIENTIGTTAAGNTVNITGNTVTNCTYLTATSATFYGIYNTAAPATVNISGNTVSNNTVPGTGSMNLISGGSPTALNITTNQVTGNSKSGAAASISGSMFCIAASTTAATVTGNTINNNSTTTAGTSSATIYGYYNLGSPTSETVTGNTITNLSIGGTTTSTSSSVYGIYSNPVSATVKDWSQNVIGNLSTSIGGTVYGIYTTTGNTVAISRNKVYGLSAGAAAGSVYGLYINSGTAITASNNLIGDLSAPAATNVNAVTGVYVGGASAANLYFNTIQQSATSSSATTFGTSGIYVASTTPTVDLRNNIVVNNSTPGATGGAAVALRFTSATVALASTANNNLYYAGTPGAANLIYAEGTTTLANAKQTLIDYKNLVIPRESNSVTENAPFLSTTGSAATFLHLNPATPTQAESNGTPISGITVDYDGQTRNATTPDLGADEGTFLPLDLTSPIDIAATALASPAAAGCYGATEAVSVLMTNNAASAINFATNPSTVTVTVTKPDNTTQTFTTTLSSGTLAAKTAQTVALTGTLDMSAAGTYSFAITTVTTGDGTAGNDNLTATRTVTAVATQPQLVTFTGFTGSNLSTVFPGWSEAAGATLPTGTSSSWTSTSFPAGNTTAKVNLFSTGKNEWIVSPKLLATSSTVLTFDAGLTDFASNAADQTGMTGTDDFMEVRISTDCGLTFARIPAFAQFNAANQPSNGSLTTYTIDLSSYAGQQFILGFFASEGTVDDAPDYDFHIDNISVRSPLPIDLAATALATPTSTQGCYSNAETVAVTVSNLGSQALNFSVNPATVTAVVTTPGGPQTLTGSITTGTLAAGATQNVTLTPTLDMTAVGTYSFAITATVTGDANTTNDALTPAPTRTVVAPVAGTLAPASTNICVSGTAALTLTGAANGSIQYQSSTDNVTFTDVAGATTAAYTTPVLTSTTYYRAQVRCGTAVATSNVSTITVTNPLVVSTNTPLAICAGSTATLTATASAGSSIRFFDVATGGTALASTTPGSYTTAALTASATYYAEAFTGGTSVAGLVDNAASNGTFSQSTSTDYPLGFTVSQSGTLTSVDVYPTAVGALTIRLYRTTGGQPAGTTTAVAGTDVTITVTAAQVGTRVTVPLNYVLTAGDYRLSNFAGGLGRFGSYTGSYPLTSGALSVTGSFTFFSSTSYSNTTYNSFFNLTFSDECAGATRTAIQVNVSQPATASFTAATGSSCGASAYQLTGTVGGSATGGTYTSSGTGTFSPDANTLTATYTPSAADVAAGTVTITLTSGGSTPCPTATATFTLSISPAPVATFSYPAATTYCAGSTSTVTPTLGSGATAGTFSSTTGLTIDATTGVITLATSTAGTYTVTNTIAASGNCAAATATSTVTITPAASAAFSYGGGTFCVSGANPTATVTGTAGGTFSSTTGLTINSTTGAITLSSSTPGTYTVTYTVAGACGTSSTQTVTITTAPVATFSYGTPATFCVSGTTNPAPSFGTGASGGVFTSTTGLTINATTGVITLASSTPGTYTVTNSIAANGGCAAATATAAVTITAAPAATFSYATATGCAGSTGTAAPTLGTAATAGTFTSTTGLVINATTGVINLATSTAGTYTVTNTVAANGGCAAATATTTFTVNPRPATPLLTAAHNGTTTTLTSSAVTGNQFFLNGVAIAGATGQTYVINGTPAQLGSYTVVVTNANGCASLPSTVLVVTAAKNGIAGTSLRLYPNPTPTGQVVLELTGYRLATQLTVMDALGRVVASELLPAASGTATHTLNLTGMASGVYLLRLSNTDGTETRRLVRE